MEYHQQPEEERSVNRKVTVKFEAGEMGKKELLINEVKCGKDSNEDGNGKCCNSDDQYKPHLCFEEFTEHPNEADSYVICNATEYLTCVLKDVGSSGDNSEDDSHDVTLECNENDEPRGGTSAGCQNYTRHEMKEALGLDEVTGWPEENGEHAAHKNVDRTSTVDGARSVIPLGAKTAAHKRTYKCEMCPHFSSGPGALKRHMVKHTGAKPYTCALCPFTTGWASVLQRHAKVTHGKDKSHVCAVCSFSTGWPAALKQHMAKHGDRKHACESCAYTTASLYDLKKHAVTHTKERPYACALCAYSTGWAASLRRHLASAHARGKTHACALCAFSTCWPESLRSHMKTHSDSKPHKCASCPYSTRHASDLRKHATVHNGERPFKCTVCPFASGWASSLRSHVASHAKELEAKDDSSGTDLE